MLNSFQQVREAYLRVLSLWLSFFWGGSGMPVSQYVKLAAACVWCFSSATSYASAEGLTIDVEDVLVFHCEENGALLLQRIDDTRYFVMADRLPAQGSRTPDGAFFFFGDGFFARLHDTELLAVTQDAERRDECLRIDLTYREAINGLLNAWHVSGIRWPGIVPDETSGSGDIRIFALKAALARAKRTVAEQAAEEAELKQNLAAALAARFAAEAKAEKETDEFQLREVLLRQAEKELVATKAKSAE